MASPNRFCYHCPPRIRMWPVVTWACKACLNIVGAKPLLIRQWANLVKRAENTKWTHVFTQLFQANRPNPRTEHTEIAPFFFGSKCLWTSFSLKFDKNILFSWDFIKDVQCSLDHQNPSAQAWLPTPDHLLSIPCGQRDWPQAWLHSVHIIPSHSSFDDLMLWDKSP